jgi:hypothetical protein
MTIADSDTAPCPLERAKAAPRTKAKDGKELSL